jgi:hypothetical protein
MRNCSTVMRSLVTKRGEEAPVLEEEGLPLFFDFPPSLPSVLAAAPPAVAVGKGRRPGGVAFLPAPVPVLRDGSGKGARATWPKPRELPRAALEAYARLASSRLKVDRAAAWRKVCRRVWRGSPAWAEEAIGPAVSDPARRLPGSLSSSRSVSTPQ